MADHVITDVKDTQPTIKQDLHAMDCTRCSACETRGKAYGRIERRQYAVRGRSDSEWDAYVNLHGHWTAVCIERERHTLTTNNTVVAMSYALTSRCPATASQARIRWP